jgi:hypothetical protein
MRCLAREEKYRVPVIFFIRTALVLDIIRSMSTIKRDIDFCNHVRCEYLLQNEECGYTIMMILSTEDDEGTIKIPNYSSDVPIGCPYRLEILMEGDKPWPKRK